MATTYRVTKVKTDKQGQKHFQEIGKLVMREGGSGVLFLHMFDGDFAVFAKKKDDPAAESGETSGGQD